MEEERFDFSPARFPLVFRRTSYVKRAFLRSSSVPPAAAAVLCYLSIYLAAAVKWLSDKLECNDNDRDG